jgi:hypothetical protein
VRLEIFYGNKEGCLVEETVMAEVDGNDEMKAVELKHRFPYINRIVLERRGGERQSNLERVAIVKGKRLMKLRANH